MHGVHLPPQRLDLGKPRDLGVVHPVHPLRVHRDDPAHLGKALPGLQDLVELFLVLRHHIGGVCVVDDIADLPGDGVLVDADDDSPGRQRPHLGVEPLRAVAAEDRHLLSRGQAQGHQPQAERAGMRHVLLPRELLPDAPVLVPEGDAPGGRSRRPRAQQPGKGRPERRAPGGSRGAGTDHGIASCPR